MLACYQVLSTDASRMIIFLASCLFLTHWKMIFNSLVFKLVCTRQRIVNIVAFSERAETHKKNPLFPKP